MAAKVIGVLHPGEMGGGVAAALRGVGHEVVWVPAGRSPETVARAEAAGLRTVGSVEELTAVSDIVLSIVPPHAALGVALQAAQGARLFVDANAVSPETAAEVGDAITRGGGTFVDGGIVGPPPSKPGTTRLYLSGQRAADVARLFSGSPMEALVLEGGPGTASAFKASYAAWTKGTDALLLAIVATARHHGIEQQLLAEWARSKPDLAARVHGAGWAASRKGWRWVREMEEIAATFASAGLPRGFHEAAAEVFRRSPHDLSAGRDDATVSRVVDSLLEDVRRGS